MDIKLNCTELCAEYLEGHILVYLKGVSEADIIVTTVDIPLEKIVSEIGPDDLLDAIGKDKCMEYFNLYEPEK